jgi:dihydrofolate synthase/folylpolyglutamate synthase
LNPPDRTLAGWLDYQQQLHPHSIDMGLERVHRVAQRLGLLPLHGRSVIVGGTNGKGSTATLLAALAQAHGMRVGLFTSPHLLRYQERIRVNGVESGADELCQAFAEIEAARGEESLTYFEFNTLAALLLFRAAAVECTVLEVGLGGRLDATNIVAADVAVLCSVGLDHCEWLGDTLAAIGAEKAGIFRAGQPVILGSTDLPDSVGAAIAALSCRALSAGRDFHADRHGDGSWDYRDGAGTLAALPAPALAGDIQYRNAATALAALRELLAPQPLAAGAVVQALRTVQLPGRFQIIPGPVEWLLDVAHNAAAAAVLATQLRARPGATRTLAVLGMLADKDVAAVTASLDALIDEWLLCGIAEPRGLGPAQLAARVGQLHGSIELCADVPTGCERASLRATAGDRVLVCGSFHTVGPALRWLGLY